MSDIQYQVQFFSRPSDEGDRPEQAEFGYDGSMTVYALELSTSDLTTVYRDLDAHASRMDCVYGEVMAVVSWTSSVTGRTLRNAYRFEHRYKD